MWQERLLVSAVDRSVAQTTRKMSITIGDYPEKMTKVNRNQRVVENGINSKMIHIYQNDHTIQLPGHYILA